MPEKKRNNCSKIKSQNQQKKEEFLFRALSVIVTNDDTVDIADCGFTAKATYFCPDHKKPKTCLPNLKDGGWVPAVTIAKQKYVKCKAIKENPLAKHFNGAFDNSFKI